MGQLTSNARDGYHAVQQGKMKITLKQTVRRASLQFIGFLGVLQVFPDYSFVLLARHELYHTAVGFPFLATEWLLMSFAYDVWTLNDVNKP